MILHNHTLYKILLCFLKITPPGKYFWDRWSWRPGKLSTLLQYLIMQKMINTTMFNIMIMLVLIMVTRIICNDCKGGKFTQIADPIHVCPIQQANCSLRQRMITNLLPVFIHDHAVYDRNYSYDYFKNILNASGYTKDSHIVKNEWMLNEFTTTLLKY